MIVPVGPSLPGCVCSNIPATLQVNISGPCPAGYFYPCTLQYAPTPAVFSGLNLGQNCFLSTSTFADSFSGAMFYFTLGCNSTQFQLSRVFLPTSYTSAYHDSTLYTWTVGLASNTCSPFLLTSGSIYSGGNPGCLVVITQ